MARVLVHVLWRPQPNWREHALVVHPPRPRCSKVGDVLALSGSQDAIGSARLLLMPPPPGEPAAEGA